MHFFSAAPIILCALAFGTDARSTIDIARTYPDGGEYDRSRKSSGAPHEIRFQGERILAKGKGTYCCGFTFAVAMDAAGERGLLADKSPDEIRNFQKQWYGATKESAEVQCGLAMKKLGVGRRVKADDARPGDFLQFWRANKSGHSVVFLGWVEEGGRRAGIQYRSSQGSTKGIGDRVEYFAETAGKDGRVDPKRMYFGRLNEKP